MTLKLPVVLASQSPRRRALCDLIGLPVTVCPSEIEEHTDKSAPQDVVMDLSRQKATAVAGKFSEDAHIVIGSDTIVWFDGKILGKPKDTEEAKRMIASYAGHTHDVYTGVTLIRTGAFPKQQTFYDHARVTVVSMTAGEIADYVATGEPFDKAGGYGIQGIFARYVERIDGDYHTVVGLPVAKLWRALKTF